MEKVQTIPITNFSGRLTRVLNGTLNSGLAKFTPSWGYDPFSKPGSLTWLEVPVDITGPISDLPLAAKPRFESNILYFYIVGHTGNIYKINPDPNYSNPHAASIVGISSVKSGTTFNYGASIEFYGDTEKIYVGHDKGVNSVNFSGSAEAQVGAQGYYAQDVYRPLIQFVGLLLFGNGPTIGAIDTTASVVSPVSSINGLNIYSQLTPALGAEARVHDLDVSPALDYTLITASEIETEKIMNVLADRAAASSSDAAIYKWNGVDTGVTSATTIPSYAVTALNTYLQNNYFFSNDSFGASLSDGVKKIVTLTNLKSPLPYSAGANGNFLFWIAPETNAASTARGAALFYFGALDADSPPGLYRLMRYSTTLANGFTYQAPLNFLTNNKYQTVDNTISSIATIGYGKHYFSTFDTNSASATSYKLWSFLVTPSGSGTPQGGVYETQTQLFSNRVTIKQIRVYTEPTVTGNAFQLDCIGSDGAVSTDGTFTYSYAAGTDVTLLQGPLERINFNPQMSGKYALGLRITNTGTTNMTINKIEVDWTLTGK